jgi:hypothetical protein
MKMFTATPRTHSANTSYENEKKNRYQLLFRFQKSKDNQVTAQSEK